MVLTAKHKASDTDACLSCLNRGFAFLSTYVGKGASSEQSKQAKRRRRDKQ